MAFTKELFRQGHRFRFWSKSVQINDEPLLFLNIPIEGYEEEFADGLLSAIEIGIKYGEKKKQTEFCQALGISK